MPVRVLLSRFDLNRRSHTRRRKSIRKKSLTSEIQMLYGLSAKNVGMDFESEPFVKIYTTESPTVRYWGFWGAVLMEQLVKKANRAGVLEVPQALFDEEDLAPAVAGLIGCGHDSVDWVRKHLPGLLDHGALSIVVARDDKRYLVITRYHEAQYNGVGQKFSKRWSAQKIRETELAIELGIIESPFWWKVEKENVA